jgi:hypothetical protein
LVIGKLSSPYGQVYGRCTRARHFQRSVKMCKVLVVVKAGLTVYLLPSLVVNNGLVPTQPLGEKDRKTRQ